MKQFKIINKEELIKAVNESTTFKDCMLHLGFSPQGGAINKRLRYWIKEYGISTNHFNGKIDRAKNIIKHANSIKIPLEDILVKNSSYSRYNLKLRLYKLGIKKPICELCGQDDTWKGKKIGLILDHINGINNDNRIENLQIVCPNCNATLDTFAGKNIKKNIAK